MEEALLNSSPAEVGACNAFTLTSLLSAGLKAAAGSSGSSTSEDCQLCCYESEEPVVCTSVVHTWLAPALASATTTAAAAAGLLHASTEIVSNSYELAATPSSLSSETLTWSVAGVWRSSAGDSAADVVTVNDAATGGGGERAWQVSVEGRGHPVFRFGSLFPATHHPYHLQRYERTPVDFLLENVDPFSCPYMSLTNVALKICEKLGLDWVSVFFLLVLVVLLRIGIVKCKVSVESRLSSRSRHYHHQEHLCKSSREKASWMALPPSRTEPLCGLQRLIDTSLSFFWRRRPIVVKKKKDGAVTSMKDSEHRERRLLPSPPDIFQEKERRETGRNNGRERSNSIASLTEGQDSLCKSSFAPEDHRHHQQQHQELYQPPQQEGRFRKSWVYIRAFFTRGLKWSSNNREVNNGRPANNNKKATPALLEDKADRVDESDRCSQSGSQSPFRLIAGFESTRKVNRHKRSRDSRGETVEDIQSFNNHDDVQSLSSASTQVCITPFFLSGFFHPLR